MRTRVQSLSSHSRLRKDLALLWLWHRPAAGALIHLLARELPYATGAAFKKNKQTNKKKKTLTLFGGKQWHIFKLAFPPQNIDRTILDNSTKVITPEKIVIAY